MPMNATYQGPGDLVDVIPVFPLPGALLLPRGQMPLNIFEPRYLAMIDAALRAGHRLIGMIQPDEAHPGRESRPNLYKVGCVGRITQLAESGDGRYLLELTGIARFVIEEELTVATAYRQCRVAYTFLDDFEPRKGEDAVDREGHRAPRAPRGKDGRRLAEAAPEDGGEEGARSEARREDGRDTEGEAGRRRQASAAGTSRGRQQAAPTASWWAARRGRTPGRSRRRGQAGRVARRASARLRRSASGRVPSRLG